MARTLSSAVEFDVDEAVNRVLEAEQEALAEIAAAEAAAAQHVGEARVHARRIVERADARMTRLENACQAAVARRVDALRREEESLHGDAGGEDPRVERLDAAIARLVDALGGNPR